MARSRFVLSMGISFALVFATLSLFAAEAQGPGGGRGRGGMGFGAGGFGGMDKFGLLRLEQVQTELKVTAEQKEKITAAQKTLSEEMRAAMPARQAGQQLTPEERQKRMEESTKKRQEITTANEKKLDALLNADQVKRLNQIALQQKGVQALKDKAVVDALKITAEQTKKVDEAIKWGQEEQQKLFSAPGGTPGERPNREAMTARMEKMQALRKEIETKAMAALTDAQKKQFEEMKGATFTIDRSAFQRGGAGGGRRGQGGGRGGGQGGEGGAGGGGDAKA